MTLAIFFELVGPKKIKNTGLKNNGGFQEKLSIYRFLSGKSTWLAFNWGLDVL